jgi:hypothetical protein
MLQQIRDPFRIFHVRFSSRNRLHVLRVHQHDLEGVFKLVKNGFPIHASPNVANWGRPRQKGEQKQED